MVFFVDFILHINKDNNIYTPTNDISDHSDPKDWDIVYVFKTNMFLKFY